MIGRLASPCALAMAASVAVLPASSGAQTSASTAPVVVPAAAATTAPEAPSPPPADHEPTAPPAGTDAPPPVPPSRVHACVTAQDPATAGARLPHHWDPRSGYGLCQEVCGQAEACVDARCIVRCVPSCREGTYCTAESECLPIPHGSMNVPTEAELQRRLGAASATATHAAVLDVGGVLFMGARPTYEWGYKHSFHVRVALMNTGMMPYFLEPQSAAERFEWGFGASAGYRRYEAGWGSLRGFYWGGGLDYAITEVRDPFQNFVATVTHYASGYGEFGYRWVFGDFLFGFGPALAVKVPFWMDRRVLPGGGDCLAAGTCPRDGNARLEGTMVVEVGWLE